MADCLCSAGNNISRSGVHFLPVERVDVGNDVVHAILFAEAGLKPLELMYGGGPRENQRTVGGMTTLFRAIDFGHWNGYVLCFDRVSEHISNDARMKGCTNSPSDYWNPRVSRYLVSTPESQQ